MSRHDERLRKQRQGSCLQLWKRSDVKSALWRELCPPRASTVLHERRPPAAPVNVSHRDPELMLLSRDEVKQERLAAVARRADPLVSAWVELIREHLGGEGLWFFSGSYRDDYGYPHGLMLPRNVQADFRRALREFGLPDTEFTCSVEEHKTGRAILHLHALLHFDDPAEGERFKRWWDSSRGWSTNDPCTDGGYAYCCKYALKGGNADTFDWSWRS